MSESDKLAFEFASRVCSQLITLSTAIISLSITLQKDVFGKPDGATDRFLFASWLCYLSTIIFGMMTLMALTGVLQPREATAKRPTIYHENVTLLGSIQVSSFGIATVFLIVYGIRSRHSRSPTGTPVEPG